MREAESCLQSGVRPLGVGRSELSGSFDFGGMYVMD